MEKFITTSPYQYSEMQAVEQYTGKLFTLTQKKILFNEDYHSISRYIAIHNEYNNTPEPDSYVYQFNYMTTGCTLTSIIVDEQTALQFISDNLIGFMQGKINSKTFQEYFEKRLTN